MRMAPDPRALAHASVVRRYTGTMADHMRTWLTEGGCDGFNLLPAWFPGELELFVDQVVRCCSAAACIVRDYEVPRYDISRSRGAPRR